MLPRARIWDPFGERFSAWPNGTKRMLTKGRRLRGKRRSLEIEVARLRERRHVLEFVPGGCGDSDAPKGVDDAAVCNSGFNASLFPATTVLVTADAVTPRAKVWDRGRKAICAEAADQPHLLPVRWPADRPQQERPR